MARAYDFAAIKHQSQRRKGDAAEPYVNHLTEVALLVATATKGADAELVIAAILHDTVEDTQTTFGELAAAFGPRVASLVVEVTDDESLPKAQRKRLQIEHAANSSPGAKLIKIADKTSNLRSVCASPPAGWPPERVAEYVAWAKEVVAGCRGQNPWLEAQFDAALAAVA
ncbi:MAG: HD domain-containing protein [Caulobacteraceae bacterium]